MKPFYPGIASSSLSSNPRRAIVKARLSNVRGWLDSVLNQIPPDQLAWAPNNGMRTISGQLVEILSIEIPLVPRLKEGRHPSKEEFDAIVGDETNFESLRRALIDVRQRTLEYLDSLSDQELEEEIPSGDQYYGTLWLPKMPRAEFFLNASEHEFYHVGQLISYLWCRGDDPYRW